MDDSLEVNPPRQALERGRSVDDVPRETQPSPTQPQSDRKRDASQGERSPDSEPRKPKSRLAIIVLIVIAAIAIIGGLIYWLLTRNQESTDDAYTEGNAVSIAPKISGYVVESHINDNIFVHAGDLLLKIDPRDYIVAREQAQASLDAALAQQQTAAVDLQTTRVRAPANLSQAQAQLMQARASLAQSENDARRQHDVDPRATTQSNRDQATTAVRSNQANVKNALAQVSVASLVKATISTAEATLHQRAAQVEQAKANLTQAELNLSYTEVRAPQDGQITRRNVDLGTLVQAGQQVFYLVTRNVWITANFKETQLDRIRIGQLVEVKVDAYSELHLHAHIDSIQGGSGARFTTFPPENATGNFVKIVRRVPVKIVIDGGLERWPFLPLGLSVEPTVYLQ